MDFWVESSQLASKLAGDANAKKKIQLKGNWQDFIARFSANGL